MALKYLIFFQPVSWLSGNAFVSGMEGLRFKSRVGQIGHSVANGSPFIAAIFLRKELRCPGTMTWRWAPPSHTLRHNTASIMKDLTFFSKYLQILPRV